MLYKKLELQVYLLLAFYGPTLFTHSEQIKLELKLLPLMLMLVIENLQIVTFGCAPAASVCISCHF